MGEGACVVEGQVCHMRKLSKRLVFVDLRQLGSTAPVYAGQPKLEVMLKELCRVLTVSLRVSVQWGAAVIPGIRPYAWYHIK